MKELQPLNRSIGIMRPTKRLIIHQSTSWTHHYIKINTPETKPKRYITLNRSLPRRKHSYQCHANLPILQLGL